MLETRRWRQEVEASDVASTSKITERVRNQRTVVNRLSLARCEKLGSPVSRRILIDIFGTSKKTLNKLGVLVTPSPLPPAPPPLSPLILILFSSQVVSCKPAKLDIPAHGRAEMKVEYVPRKINSKYRKTVTVVNMCNPHGNVDVEIAASNTDTHHVLYHSHFYKACTVCCCLVFVIASSIDVLLPRALLQGAVTVTTSLIDVPQVT